MKCFSSDDFFGLLTGLNICPKSFFVDNYPSLFTVRYLFHELKCGWCFKNWNEHWQKQSLVDFWKFMLEKCNKIIKNEYLTLLQVRNHWFAIMIQKLNKNQEFRSVIRRREQTKISIATLFRWWLRMNKLSLQMDILKFQVSVRSSKVWDTNIWFFTWIWVTLPPYTSDRAPNDLFCFSRIKYSYVAIGFAT